jgi:hypothetical protein
LYCYGVGRCCLGPSISIEQLEIGLRVVTGKTCPISREARTGGMLAEEAVLPTPYLKPLVVEIFVIVQRRLCAVFDVETEGRGNGLMALNERKI